MIGLIRSGGSISPIYGWARDSCTCSILSIDTAAKVIDYELSSTLEKVFVLKCLKRPFSRCKPEIMNSDQGSHFTNADYLELFEKEGIRVSMDGKGQARDNSRTERYFRSLKYECIYLNEFEDPRALRKGIVRFTITNSPINP